MSNESEGGRVARERGYTGDEAIYFAESWNHQIVRRGGSNTIVASQQGRRATAAATAPGNSSAPSAALDMREIYARRVRAVAACVARSEGNTTGPAPAAAGDPDRIQSAAEIYAHRRRAAAAAQSRAQTGSKTV